MANKKRFNSFEELLAGSETPILVDFYTEWCGPCRMMGPILEQVQAAMKDKLQVVKIDSERYSDLAERYHIHALPTLVLFKDGEPIDRIEGVSPPEELIERFKSLV
jgi:thioredoxin